jgi:membrane protease YdiL (CAAX protease family)
VPILVVAVVTVVIDVWTAWAEIDLAAMGRVPVSPAMPTGVLLVLMIGPRRVGLDPANRWAWREFLAVALLGMFASMISYSLNVSTWTEAFGLVQAALGEEIVYRLAILVVSGATFARLLGRDWRNAAHWGTAPGVMAMVASGLVFTFLPGHVAQMNDTLHALPFVSFGIVMSYAVLRTGALLPAAIVHAFMNLTTIAALEGDVSPGLRTTFALVALFTLIAGTIVAGLRLGIFRRVPIETLEGSFEVRSPTRDAAPPGLGSPA